MDVDLSIYTLKSENLKLVYNLQKKTRSLELSEKFAKIWESLKLENTDKIYYWIGSSAGFSDTRIIYTWLKTREMFNTKHQFLTLKIENSLENSLLSLKVLDLIAKTEQNNSEKIIYSAPPRITLAKYLDKNIL